MATDLDGCYRHSDRRAGVACQRCDRPICPSCMRAASVGFHCPDFTSTGRQRVLTARSLTTRPIVTQVLIALNVAVFVIGLTEGREDALAGRSGFSADGGLFGPLVAAGDWWRIVTSGFLHAGLAHLGFNMFALWVLGSQLEPALGRLRFALVYGTALLAGSLGVLVLSPDSLTVGASGAVFGLMGAAAAAQRVRGTSIWDSGIGSLLVINLLFTFLIPGISIGGHLGGLAGGFAAGSILLAPGVSRGRSPAAPAVLCAALALACVAASLWVASNPLV